MVAKRGKNILLAVLLFLVLVTPAGAQCRRGNCGTVRGVNFPPPHRNTTWSRSYQRNGTRYTEYHKKGKVKKVAQKCGLCPGTRGTYGQQQVVR